MKVKSILKTTNPNPNYKPPIGNKTKSVTVCHCNLKKNAELIAKILDADSNNEIYRCCDTCGNYFSENAAETCLEESEGHNDH